MSSNIRLSNIRNGIAGGLLATMAAAGMMLMNNALHRIPELHVARTLAAVLSAADRPIVGWIAFLVLGIFVFGTAFALLAPKVPTRSYVVKGVVFGMVSWLLMMLVLLPLAGAGVFGVNRGSMLAPAALVLNLVYWLVLSLVYRSASGAAAAPARRVKA